MTDHNAAAQAAHTNQLSDEYVNAVIQRHGYDSPEAVIARLWQWIGLNGGENSVTLLMYEAHKMLSKLRAPVANSTLPLEKALHELVSKIAPGLDTGDLLQDAQRASAMLDAMQARAALANGPVADTRLRNLVKEAITWMETGGGPAVSLCADLRAALASAPADPEAAEVDFLVRVLENLETWRAEDWSELLERRPAILAMLRPLVSASAPVAGEAQHDTDSVCAWQVWWNQHKSRYTTTRQASLAAFAAGKEWRGAAPQAREAKPVFSQCVLHGPAPEGFADWYQWLEAPVKKGAFIRAATAADWERSEDASRASEAQDLKAALGAALCRANSAEAMWRKCRDELKAVRAALSAQPGAQKEQSDA